MTLKLEVFETKSPASDVVVVPGSELEEARLQAYESGYSAGWEDAMSATSDEAGRLTAELINNLQNLSFTYHEARTHLLRSVRPVLLDITTRLLPEVAREALAPVVLDTLMPLIDDLSDQPVHVVLNPSARAAVEKLLSQAAGLPLEIEEEPTMGEGQVYLKLATGEHRIDLDGATAEIIQAVHDFFDYSEKDHPNGKDA